MNKRAFFLASIVLGLLAIVCHFEESKQLSASFDLLVHDAQAHAQQVNYVPNAEIARLRNDAHLFSLIGSLLIFFCMALMLAAYRRGERGKLAIPLIVLLAYFIVLMLC